MLKFIILKKNLKTKLNMIAMLTINMTYLFIYSLSKCEI